MFQEGIRFDRMFNPFRVVSLIAILPPVSPMAIQIRPLFWSFQIENSNPKRAFTIKQLYWKTVETVSAVASCLSDLRLKPWANRDWYMTSISPWRKLRTSIIGNLFCLQIHLTDNLKFGSAVQGAAFGVVGAIWVFVWSNRRGLAISI